MDLVGQNVLVFMVQSEEEKVDEVNHMRLCKHEPHKTIDWIQSPKWSTNEVLIRTDAVTPRIEHYLVQFTDKSPKGRYGWFYISGKNIRKAKTQPNGRGMVYVVSLDKREEFTPISEKECIHAYK